MIKAVLGIGLLLLAIYLFLTLRQIWISFGGLLKASREFGAAVSNFSTPQLEAPQRPTNLYEDPRRRQAAKADRNRVRAYRQESRRQRLAAATDRWDNASTDFYQDRFGPQRREEARKSYGGFKK
ncbi:MAG: hypothetical protein Q4E03_04395 [Trueperella sp.]|nr:hypothetical protein [Trueperella sp.]